MNRQTAGKLQLFVNNPTMYLPFKEHIEERIEALKNDFMHCQTMEEVEGVKRTINELKNLMSLREAVQQELDRKDGK